MLVGRRPEMRKYLFAVVLFVALIGVLSTGFMVHSIRLPLLAARPSLWPSFIGLSLCALLTLGNLMMRWLRWHYLVRRFTHTIRVNDSILVFFATLPALVVPFYLGELLRVALLRRRYSAITGYLVAIWFVERIVDAATLLLFLLLVRNSLIGAIMAISIIVPILVFGGKRVGRFGWQLRRLILFLGGVSALAWLAPVGGLYLLLAQQNSAVSLGGTVAVFTSSTLLGGLTGLPLGVAVTGSTMIAKLSEIGAPRETAILAVALFRLGTVWFGVALGLAVLLWRRRRLIQLAGSGAEADHFDEIAGEYGEIIPAHVREQLLSKKVRMIIQRLERRRVPLGARGVDVGCGQGWYLCELARRGFVMHGVDRSESQVKLAAQYAAAQGVSAVLRQGDATALPYGDGEFDFAYSINVFHHIVDPATRLAAFSEIARVLKPGGMFFLHEMNAENLFFRLYMGYFFPLIRKIDEGTEQWILPSWLPRIQGGAWDERIEYFTFFPDFIPAVILRWLSGVEAYFERSHLRRFSAHYMAVFNKVRP